MPYLYFVHSQLTNNRREKTMLNLAQHALLGRKIRSEEVEELGRPTQEKIIEAIDAGRLDEAKELAAYMVTEGKSLHDLFCDWIWDMLTQVGETSGEEAVYQLLRSTQQTWMLRRTWKAFIKLPVEDRVAITAEVMRAHHCGPKQDGGIEVLEESDRFVIRMDPCGSGGRMRRGDPVDGTPSRLGPPYNFGVTQEAHDWSWGRKNVPYYCLHCAVNEILPIEWGGWPLWVTDFDPDEQAPCQWCFYESPELIPASYYERLGFEKPDKIET